MSFFSKMPLYAVAVLALSAAPSSAAVIATLGPLTGDGHTHYGADVGPGAFADFITFSTSPLSSDTDLSINVGNTFTAKTTNQSISDLMLSLYSGTYNKSKADGGGILLTSASTVPFSTSNYGELAYSLTNSGDYYFEISAKTGSKASASYGGTISYSVEAVPLPSSLPMLAGALLAIAGGGHVVNRRRSSKRVALQH